MEGNGVFIVNLEHISHLVLEFLIVNFEHVFVEWEIWTDFRLSKISQK